LQSGLVGGQLQAAPRRFLAPIAWIEHYWAVATQADVRRIAMSLPGTEEGTDRFAFSVPVKGKQKGYAWVWMERITPKKPRVANPSVLAVRTTTVSARDLMIAAEPTKYFTEPHYAGFPAVLVQLAEVSVRELRPLLAEAWACQAPKELLKTGENAGKSARKQAKR
jgi:hypothetical protein